MPLLVVAVPIGHPEDITLRAIEALKSADLILVEEAKVGRRLLSRLGIKGKEPIPLNEHNEAEEAPLILAELKRGKSVALISDAGTPLFADPGLHLVQACHAAKIPVSPIPGASSLTAALSVAGIRIDQFIYAGFLPRSAEERQKALKAHHPLGMPLVLYDTPYRLQALLEDVALIYGASQRIALMMALTQEEEEIFVGEVGQMLARLEEEKIKKEFVLILEAGQGKGGKRSGAKKSGSQGSSSPKSATKDRSKDRTKDRPGGKSGRPGKSSKPPRRKLGPQAPPKVKRPKPAKSSDEKKG